MTNAQKIVAWTIAEYNRRGVCTAAEVLALNDRDDVIAAAKLLREECHAHIAEPIIERARWMRDDCGRYLTEAI